MAKVSVDINEIENKHRYGLLLEGISLGLNKLGIKSISFSSPIIEKGRLVFTINKKEKK